MKNTKPQKTLAALAVAAVILSLAGTANAAEQYVDAGTLTESSGARLVTPSHPAPDDVSYESVKAENDASAKSLHVNFGFASTNVVDAAYFDVAAGLSQSYNNPATYSLFNNGQLVQNTSTAPALSLKIGGIKKLENEKTGLLLAVGAEADVRSINGQNFVIPTATALVSPFDLRERGIYFMPHLGYSQQSGLATGADLFVSLPEAMSVYKGSEALRVGFTNFSSDNLGGAHNVFEIGMTFAY